MKIKTQEARVPVHIYCYLLDVRGYQVDLRMLQCGVVTGEMADEDVVPVTHNVTIQEWCSGKGNSEGGRLVVPVLPSEGDPETVNDGLTINLFYGVDYGSLVVGSTIRPS